MFYVYVLKSLKQGRLYIGMSSDPQKRLAEHNAGLQSSTKGYRPYQLLLTEEYPDRKQARQREKSLKSGCRRESIKILFP